MKTGSHMEISVGETLFGRENPQPGFSNLVVCYYMTNRQNTNVVFCACKGSTVIVVSFSQDHHG